MKPWYLAFRLKADGSEIFPAFCREIIAALVKVSEPG
jgi:hypothetical protein